MKNNYLLKSLKFKGSALLILLILSITSLQAQTQFTPGAPWDFGWNSGGSAGTTVYPNGVVQLLSNSGTSCEGAAIHETTSQITTGTSWSICYNVFFGCPGQDNIGNDKQGDGMAWSLYNPLYPGCDVSNSGTLKLGSCGGGLGYNATPCAKVITIEFDTYSSQNSDGLFDANYGGVGNVSTGDDDEISLHYNDQAQNSGTLFSTDPGNLEDGQQHTICISYTPNATIGNGGTMVVKIDGVVKFSYDMGPTNNLEDYFDNISNGTFDATALNQMWSSGKQNATNPATVAPAGVSIVANVTGTLCPATVSVSASSTGCSGNYTLSSLVVPPTGCTTTQVQFYDGATLLQTVTTSPYTYSYVPANGSHSYTAKATFSGACGTQTSSVLTTTVGASSSTLKLTSTAPVIGGGVDAIWSSYTSRAMNYRQSGSPVNDANLGANWTVTYDNTYLYVLIDVTDNISDTDDGTIWQNDAVEIFVDINKDAGSGYGSNDQHYLFNRNGVSDTEDNGHGVSGVVYAVTEKPVGQGYYMEVKMPWTTLAGGVPYSPPPGGSIGLDVAVDDADGAQRTNIVTWGDPAFGEHSNASLMPAWQFSGCDPLPVDLLIFTATKKNGTVVLDWATASEQNNSKFIIERSSDGINWPSIGEVIGVGNTKSISNYSFTDANPLDGTSYYRLLQIDIDGKGTLSKTVVVNTSGQLVSVSPNPFNDELTIKTNIKGEISISVLDVLGRSLYDISKETEDGQVTIHPELASGAYIVTVSAGELVEHYRVIKK